MDLPLLLVLPPTPNFGKQIVVTQKGRDVPSEESIANAACDPRGGVVCVCDVALSVDRDDAVGHRVEEGQQVSVSFVELCVAQLEAEPVLDGSNRRQDHAHDMGVRVLPGPGHI